MKIKHLRWKLFKAWARENAGTFPKIMIAISSAYLTACLWYGRWLLGPRSVNVLFATIIVGLFTLSLVALVADR